MPEALGFSVYLNTFEQQWPVLSRWAGTNAPVFLSLNMRTGDRAEARRICHRLADSGFRIIADVSTETCELFGQPDLVSLGRELKLWALRIDFGFTPDEIRAMAEETPLVLNASTTDPEDAKHISAGAKQIFALHNFYPRPDTGLDREMLLKTTENLKAAGLKVQAFIPGDSWKRGPIGEGLPTLEEHRQVLPSAAFVDLALGFGIDEIFVGDPGISQKEQDRIALFCRDRVISVPAQLDPEFSYLYDLDFTCRMDSPGRLIRFEESRTTARREIPLEPGSCKNRNRGAITMDNRDYACYSGEIQMIRSDLPADPRVNVIGQVPQNAWLLMDRIQGGRKFRLVRI